ncbi:hypothetical protein ACWIGE_14655 [Streptomyces diastaticus]
MGAAAAAALKDEGVEASAVTVDVTGPASGRYARDRYGALHLTVQHAGIGGASAPTGE